MGNKDKSISPPGSYISAYYPENEKTCVFSLGGRTTAECNYFICIMFHIGLDGVGGVSRAPRNHGTNKKGNKKQATVNLNERSSDVARSSHLDGDIFLSTLCESL